MDSALLADIVVILHLAYVWFVTLGYVAILVGWPLGWLWIRNRTFRRLHLAAIGLVAVEAVVGVVCPLTWLENLLAPDRAGATFMGRIARNLLYYDLPPWVFTVGYVVLLVVALALYWVVRPRDCAGEEPRPAAEEEVGSLDADAAGGPEDEAEAAELR